MRFLVHLGRLVVDTVQLGVASRRYALIALILLGLVLLALTATAQASAPFLLYPFA